MVNLEDISDLLIPVDFPFDTVIYPHEERVGKESPLLPDIHKIIQLAGRNVLRDDFRIVLRGKGLRVSRFTDVDKVTLAVRRTAATVPALDSLGLPAVVRELVNNDRLMKTGLVIVSGGHGSGKSTTCAALVRQRLERVGGVARTIEDPIEYPLSGKLGKGFCYQVELHDEANREAEMEKEIRKAMRGYPSGKDGVLMFGEIRDSLSAAEALRASLAGRLVITTVHANKIEDVLGRLVSRTSGVLGESEIYDILESSFRLIIHQDLQNKRLVSRSLTRTQTLCSILHGKKLSGIRDEAQRQNISFSQNRVPDLLY